MLFLPSKNKKNFFEVCLQTGLEFLSEEFLISYWPMKSDFVPLTADSKLIIWG